MGETHETVVSDELVSLRRIKAKIEHKLLWYRAWAEEAFYAGDGHAKEYWGGRVTTMEDILSAAQEPSDEKATSAA